jgi:hypothetical protein
MFDVEVSACSVINASGAVTLDAAVLPRGGFYLVGYGATDPAPDATGGSQPLTGEGEVELYCGGTRIDAVGWGTAAIMDGGVPDGGGSMIVDGGMEKEGPAGPGEPPLLAPLPSAALTYERRARATSTALSLGPDGSEELDGNGYDTDMNATDFVTQDQRRPQNTRSPPEPWTP